MTTPADWTALRSPTQGTVVSVFLPTHVRGSEVRQGPIRLKNLSADARDKLLAAGMAPSDADELLAPATALIDDYEFWQHQGQGLALFLAAGTFLRYQVPVPLTEKVVVGNRFHVRPLLPMLTADGAFAVLSVTADRVRLLRGSRFALVEDDGAGLPSSAEDGRGEPDYENPVQASPVARPHTGSIDISNAQVYGDSPTDWRKARLVDFARRVAAAAQSVTRALPLVLVAGPELAGHIRSSDSLGSRLAGVVEVDPAALTDAELHAAAYAVAQPLLDASRRKAVDGFERLRGSQDDRAIVDAAAVVQASAHGRIESLLLRPDTADTEGLGEGPVDIAVLETLRAGGEVHLLDEGTTSPDVMGAVLRY